MNAKFRWHYISVIFAILKPLLGFSPKEISIRTLKAVIPCRLSKAF